MNRAIPPFRIAICLLLALFISLPALAQFRAGVQGTVLDPSGAVVAGAKVTASNQETGVSKSTVSTGTGFYRVDFLPPGTYNVTVDAPSFQGSTRKGVAVGGDAFTSVDFNLKAKTTTTDVTVTDQVNGIQTETANIQQTITSSQVNNLPAFGRDPYELVRLAPGVFGDQARAAAGNAVSLPNSQGPGGSNSSIFQTENQVQISGNGQRTSANSYQIDGVNVNSLNWGGAAVVTPNIESVKEMNVTTSTYTAEDGRNTGVQVKVVSQTGTNSLHGSGLFKYDDPNWNADPRWGGPNNAKPHAVQNAYKDYAASIGGPIIKDRLFFFFSYEGLHQTNNSFATGYFLTPQFINLVKTSRSGTPIATLFGASGLNARVTQDLSATQGCADFATNNRPCAVVPGGLDIGSPTGAYGQYVTIQQAGYAGGGLDGVPDLGYGQFQLPSKSTGNQYNGRVDFNMGHTNFAASTYITKLNSLSADGGSGGMPAADVNLQPTNLLFTFLANTTLTPTLLNEARFNASRFAYNQVTSNAGIGVNWGLPHIQVEGLPISRLQMAAPWGTTTPGILAQNQFEFRDIVSKVIGNMAWKFGAEYREEQNNNNELGGARPFYSFSGLWNLANATPIFEQLDASPINGSAASGQVYLRTHNIALFAQNDWRVAHNLTLNLGLRWEYFSPLSSAHSKLYNITIPGGTDVANATMNPTDNIYHKDHNNFGPRLGFAWSPGSFKDKMVVRGGFGVGFDRLPSAIYANMARNPPNFAFFGLCCGTSSADFGTPFANGQIQFFTGASNSPTSYPANTGIGKGVNANGFPTTGTVEVYGAAPNTATPYVYNYSLGTEYQLPAKMVLGVGYEGSSSHKLLRIVPGHIIFPQSPAQSASTTGANPLYYVLSDVTANYNSLNVNVRRAYSSGVQLTMKYRWSKSLDELSNEGPGFATNQTWPQNDTLEYGPSDYDATHYAEASMLYHLPFFKHSNGIVSNILGGWEVSGIYSFHTGFPWTPIDFFNCYQLVSNQSICPVRPVRYFGGALNSGNTQTFITSGLFPGNLTGNSASPSAYFDVSKGVPGVGRNSFRGPRYTDLDMTVGKGFSITERAKLDLRANVFNVTNHLNLAPFGFASPSTNIGDTNFGKATASLAGRVVEIQARISF